MLFTTYEFRVEQCLYIWKFVNARTRSVYFTRPQARTRFVYIFFVYTRDSISAYYTVFSSFSHEARSVYTPAAFLSTYCDLSRPCTCTWRKWRLQWRKTSSIKWLIERRIIIFLYRCSCRENKTVFFSFRIVSRRRRRYRKRLIFAFLCCPARDYRITKVNGRRSWYICNILLWILRSRTSIFRVLFFP